MQSVSVYFKGGKGVASGADGSYTLTTGNTKLTVIQFSYVGYKAVTKAIVTNKEQVVNVNLELSEGKNVVVKTNKRGKYSNKNNPAVELIRKVIDNKSKNKISAYDYVSYEQYEKMEVSLSNTPEKLINNKLFKNFKSIFENRDSTQIKGKALLPFYLEEKISQKYYRNNPEKNNTYILGDKKVNFGEYIDVPGISSYLIVCMKT
ncbi:MAG: carboxypeptidase-like regulatory domain-containing protein [Segetibacter sp.]